MIDLISSMNDIAGSGIRCGDVSAARRSPRGEERKRDPERTRERILDAALREFGEHGYAGARISAIARRAGVNQQLISYYFDGKQGLYRELSARWQALSTALNQPDMPIHEVVGNFLQASVDHREWARLLAWQGLSGNDSDDDAEADAYFHPIVEDVGRRQRNGELAEDLDPAYVLLVLFGAAFAPTAIPQIVRRITGKQADSPEFLSAYAEQLRRIVEHLAGNSKAD
jgi:TetR/AcrR family transcriptional regulator